LKVLIIHNDLRVYWKRRLIYLRNFLASKNIDFFAVELFGKGSPYNFDPFNKTEQWWDCLFPDKNNTELTKHEIRQKIFSKLDEINPDVVIAGSIVFYAGALGLRWAKNHQKKFIMFDDAKATDVKRNPLVQGIKNLITRQIDALWLPSVDYEQGYAALLKRKSIHFFYGYDCIDNEHFKLKGEKTFGHQQIICIARLVPIKNIENLIRAWKFVEENDAAWSLALVGDGPLHDGLKMLAASLSLKKVVFLGSVDNEQVLHYLHQADAFILPSWAESWGLVVNEAMAAGLPVLLSNKVNAAGTLLKNGINGYSFSPDNIDEIQQRITDFIRLPVSAKKDMAAGSLKIIGAMDFENMGSGLLSALNLLAARPAKRPGLLARLAINVWHGRYNTTGWDSVKALNNKDFNSH